MSAHKIDLAADEDTLYISTCDFCGSKVFDETCICQTCWDAIDQVKSEQEAATKLMMELGIPLYKSRTALNYNEYSLRAIDLYTILTDKDKLKELIFRLNNKAFM